jgi:hypothetical protein
MICSDQVIGKDAAKLKAGTTWKWRRRSWRHTVEIERVEGVQIFFRKMWNGERAELPGDLFLQSFQFVE